jgi:hypothetical protein
MSMLSIGTAVASAFERKMKPASNPAAATGAKFGMCGTMRPATLKATKAMKMKMVFCRFMDTFLWIFGDGQI